jgi:hypothetical protein
MGGVEEEGGGRGRRGIEEDKGGQRRTEENRHESATRDTKIIIKAPW